MKNNAPIAVWLLILGMAGSSRATPNNMRTDILAVKGDYKVVRQYSPPESPAPQPDKVIIYHKQSPIFEYTAHHQHENQTATSVRLIYDDLADRGSGPQPKVFENVTGDGLPNIILYEYVLVGQIPHYWVTVLTLNRNKVIAASAIEDEGEIMFFNDYTKTKKLEFVTTDHERRFLYDRQGIPISSRVWCYDKDYNEYFRATAEVRSAR